jgi:soluble lytic murein transglycosylase
MVCLALAAPAASAGPVQTLGEAYRALEAGDGDRALALGKQLGSGTKLNNPDYVDYVVGQSAYLTGNYKLARARFKKLAKNKRSRFDTVAAWRLADAEWQLGKREAARVQYETLVNKAGRRPDGDLAVARYRIAEAHASAKRTERAIDRFQRVIDLHPEHPLAERARTRAHELGANDELTPAQRIHRAERLTDAHLWREAIHELDQIGDDVPVETERLRDYNMGRTLFKMRRQYELAGRLLLSVWEHMGADKSWALFHGARGLSRAHLDAEAIGWYQKLVDEMPSSKWAPEAAYLSGWLEFNQGNFRASIEPLAKMRKRYPKSKWTDEAMWYQAFAHYVLGEYENALPLFATLGKQSGRLDGGQGKYWHARALQKLEREADALAEYRDIVGRWPFSWYALLSRERLRIAGDKIDPFGDNPRSPDDATALDAKPDAKTAAKLASDPLIAAVDELIAAGLPSEASVELRRGEKAFLGKHGRPAGMAMVLDRYRKAGNYNRPWMLAVVHGGSRALDAPPEGAARLWWEHAYPQAYKELVEKHNDLGGSPEYYLYSIMRKESGFDPHTVSYADALGLLQMIPPTTRRVAPEVGLEYTDDLLYDPDNNIKAGSWYIGRLFHKFKGQVPIATASFNSGPGPVMRWLDANGDRPIDEYVELISYSQARGYGKKVTETYARYLYLYEGTIYEQPLDVDPDYVKDDLTY